MGPSKAMDRVRRTVDGAMIFASLLMLTWPAYFERGRFNLLLPIAVGLFLGIGVLFLARRWPLRPPVRVCAPVGIGVLFLARGWPLLQYAPVAAAVIMAGYWHYRDGRVSA